MALQKAVTLEQGYDADYWRISPTCSVDFAEHRAQATLILHANQAARQANKRWVEIPHELHRDAHEALRLEGTDFDTAIASGDVRGALYAKLKASVAFFADAVDC